MLTLEQYFCGMAATAYVVTSLIIAAVRWFHMCRPFDRNPDYYYPGRKVCTAVCLCAVLVIPYILFPDNKAAWLIAKTYFLPLELFFIGIMLFSYFGSVMHWRKWIRPAFFLGLSSVLLIMSGPVIFVLIRGVVSKSTVGYGIIYVLGALMTAFCFFAIAVILRWAREADDSDYSNPSDFPVVFARKMVFMTLITIGFCWAAVASDDRIALGVLNVAMSLISLALLVFALHPQRHRSLDEGAETQPLKSLSMIRQKSIARAIKRVLEEEEAFLDPHLTIQDVARRVGSSRTYVASVLSNEFGGFFLYVNTLRLDYSFKYMETHPQATMSEVVSESGFGSRQTYYTVRLKLQK